MTDCDNCQNCSSNLPTCSNLFNECLNDFGCSDILFCISCTCAPGDSVCYQECIAQDPGSSADLFNQYASCVVCACKFTCGQESNCP